MRDPDRINTIILAFAEKWKEAPDQRFGQLFANLTGHHRDSFNVEDDELMAALGIDPGDFAEKGRDAWKEFMDDLEKRDFK